MCHDQDEIIKEQRQVYIFKLEWTHYVSSFQRR